MNARWLHSKDIRPPDEIMLLVNGPLENSALQNQGKEIMEMHTKISQPLYGEILKTAQSYFLGKGFEKTTVTDICNNLDINVSQFSMYFESLDEVLETLWAG